MRDQASFCFRVEGRGGWNENVELSKFVPPLTTQIFASSVFLWHRRSEEETPPVSCIVSPAPRVRGKRAGAKNRRRAMQLHRCRRTFQLRLLRLRNVNISNSRSFRIKYRCSCELCDIMETVFDAVSQISPLAIFLPEPILTATPEGSLGNPLIYPAGAPGPCWCCTTGATLRPLPPGDTGALLAQFHWLLPCTQQQSTPPSSKTHQEVQEQHQDTSSREEHLNLTPVWRVHQKWQTDKHQNGGGGGLGLVACHCWWRPFCLPPPRHRRCIQLPRFCEFAPANYQPLHHPPPSTDWLNQSVGNTTRFLDVRECLAPTLTHYFNWKGSNLVGGSDILKWSIQW